MCLSVPAVCVCVCVCVCDGEGVGRGERERDGWRAEEVIGGEVGDGESFS